MSNHLLQVRLCEDNYIIIFIIITDKKIIQKYIMHLMYDPSGNGYSRENRTN